MKHVVKYVAFLALFSCGLQGMNSNNNNFAIKKLDQKLVNHFVQYVMMHVDGFYVDHLKSFQQQDNVNDVNFFSGKSRLHYAVLFNAKDVAHELVKHGAEVDVFDKKGRTPLHYAVFAKNMNLVKALAPKMSLDYVNLQDDSGVGALHYACKSKSFKLISALLKGGANPNEQLLVKGGKGLSAFALALSKAGDDKQAYDTTCLFLIDMNGLLYAHGLDVAVASKNGESPLTIAEKLKFTETLELLKTLNK